MILSQNLKPDLFKLFKRYHLLHQRLHFIDCLLYSVLNQDLHVVYCEYLIRQVRKTRMHQKLSIRHKFRLFKLEITTIEWEALLRIHCGVKMMCLVLRRVV